MLLFVPVREIEEHAGPCLRFPERMSHVASTGGRADVLGLAVDARSGGAPHPPLSDRRRGPES